MILVYIGNYSVFASFLGILIQPDRNDDLSHNFMKLGLFGATENVDLQTDTQTEKIHVL